MKHFESWSVQCWRTSINMHDLMLTFSISSWQSSEHCHFIYMGESLENFIFAFISVCHMRWHLVFMNSNYSKWTIMLLFCWFIGWDIPLHLQVSNYKHHYQDYKKILFLYLIKNKTKSLKSRNKMARDKSSLL